MRLVGLRDDAGGVAADAVLEGTAARCCGEETYCCGPGGLCGGGCTRDIAATAEDKVSDDSAPRAGSGRRDCFVRSPESRRVEHDHTDCREIAASKVGSVLGPAVLQRLEAVERWRPRRGSIKRQVKVQDSAQWATQ